MIGRPSSSWTDELETIRASRLDWSTGSGRQSYQICHCFHSKLAPGVKPGCCGAVKPVLIIEIMFRGSNKRKDLPRVIAKLQIWWTSSPHASSPKDNKVFFSFFTFLAGFVDFFFAVGPSLPLSFSFSFSSSSGNLRSSSWLPAFRFLDLKLADDEEENDKPFCDADLEASLSADSELLSSTTSLRASEGSGRGGKPFSEIEWASSQNLNETIAHLFVLCFLLRTL